MKGKYWFYLLVSISAISLQIIKFWLGMQPSWDNVVIAGFCGFLLCAVLDGYIEVNIK
jgi:hypothetical protein